MKCVGDGYVVRIFKKGNAFFINLRVDLKGDVDWIVVEAMMLKTNICQWFSSK